MTGLIIGKSTIKTIIFDFDGTLAKLNIDFQEMRKTVSALIFSYGIAQEQLKTDFVLEMIDAAFEIIKKQSGRSAKTFYDEAYSIIEKIEIKAAEEGELFNHTKRLLTSLRKRNISCGIITRNCIRAVKIVFPDILDYCPVIVCRDDVNRVKPHPQHINLALEKLGSSPETTLMIGDHPIDIKTGRNAGTLTCGVLTGRCQKRDFIEAGADIILTNAAEIMKMVVDI